MIIVRVLAVLCMAVVKQGFSSKCGGVYTQSHGSFRSPLYSIHTKIGETLTCDYIIKAPYGQRIKIVFLDHILKTPCCSCVDDYIELRDGNNGNATLIGRYCAHNLPKIVYSTKREIWLRFRTDYKTSTDNRFKLTFDTVCGYHFSKLEGVFTSNRFPGPYTPNSECIYTISVPRGRLKVSFESFDVEARSVVCEFDFLEVKEILYVEYDNALEYPYGEVMGSRTRRYCGSETPPNIYSTTGGFLWFRFKTDSNGQRSGFKAKYRTVSVGEGTCNKKFSVPKGLIYSKNYPFPFPRKTECLWEIEVQPNKHISLSFDTFNFSRHAPECKYGYLRVYDGLGFDTQIGQYCGPKLPHRIVSRRNTMSLQLVSSSVSDTGWFSAEYTTSDEGPCGKDKFTCASLECVAKSKHCDSKNDCQDNSDEVGCPPEKETPTWYSFWPVTVVVVMLFMGVWLWRTWRKYMTPRSDIQVTYCASSPCHHNSMGGLSETTEPPSYHEAISQPAHTGAPPPSYEEAISSQPACYIQNNPSTLHNNLTESQRHADNVDISNISSQDTNHNRTGQPYTSHRPMDRNSEA